MLISLCPLPFHCPFALLHHLSRALCSTSSFFFRTRSILALVHALLLSIHSSTPHSTSPTLYVISPHIERSSSTHLSSTSFLDAALQNPQQIPKFYIRSVPIMKQSDSVDQNACKLKATHCEYSKAEIEVFIVAILTAPNNAKSKYQIPAH